MGSTFTPVLQGVFLLYGVHGTLFNKSTSFSPYHVVCLYHGFSYKNCLFLEGLFL